MSAELKTSSLDVVRPAQSEPSLTMEHFPAGTRDFARTLYAFDKLVDFVRDCSDTVASEAPDFEYVGLIKTVLREILENLQCDWLVEPKADQSAELERQLDEERRKVLSLEEELDAEKQKAHRLEEELDLLKETFKETEAAKEKLEAQQEAGSSAVQKIDEGNRLEIHRLQDLIEAKETEWDRERENLRAKLDELEAGKDSLAGVEEDLRRRVEFLELEKKMVEDSFNVQLQRKEEELKKLQEEIREADGFYAAALSKKDGADKENSLSSAGIPSAVQSPSVLEKSAASADRTAGLNDTLLQDPPASSLELSRLVNDSVVQILENVYKLSNEFVQYAKEVDPTEKRVESGRRQRLIVHELLEAFKKAKQEPNALQLDINTEFYKQLCQIKESMDRMSVLKKVK